MSSLTLVGPTAERVVAAWRDPEKLAALCAEGRRVEAEEAAERERRAQMSAAELADGLFRRMVANGFRERTSRLVCTAADPWDGISSDEAAAMRAWTESPDGRGLLIFGPVGSRKTGALHSAGCALLQRGEPVRYVRADGSLLDVLLGQTPEDRERRDTLR